MDIETLKDNELIAQFMGCDFELITLFKGEVDDNGTSREIMVRKWSRPKFFSDDLYNIYGWGSYSDGKHMKYSVSWDWLMPVVEKIGSLGYFVMINKWTSVYTTPDGDPLSITVVEGNSKLLNTYKAVVKFIQWYNEQPKTDA